MGVEFMDKTVSINEMPSWYQDNIYILTGYRRIQFTYSGCIRSLTYLHNETGNIYTHLIGTLGFLLLTFLTYLALIPIIETTQWQDHVVLATFLASAMACLGLSTTFHLCCCHSLEVSKAWNKLDYVGIVLLIV
ncbi:hypothetical protein HDU76_005509 [Blyttiomyces sp. JEL0837]|nr:hypothetical protein HDU76_005509 [Blyttiomyces sp. JEL0837]